MKLLLIAIGGGVWLALLAVGIVLWRRSRDARLRERIKQAAGPLSKGANTEIEPEESIFRQTERRSRLSRAINARYPLIEPRRAIPMMILAALGASIAAWFATWFLQFTPGWWIVPLLCLVAYVAARMTASLMQKRKEAEFIRQFPEVVDQIVRLARAGVPPLQAISVVAEDAPPPAGPALQEVCDGLDAGLDAETALSLTSRRIRLAEFTLFASVIRLQRRSGGGITNSFSNLANTLRENRTISLKARASTAQTRLTLMVLTAMPVFVLSAQSFISPESVDILFESERGIFMLRMGIGMIVVGLLVARGIGARFQH
ncbi:MAG: type II secretion system F family protein [Rhodospirillales bacterium]|nr:type II secretion system F family protein [Rhodospirillales bacterium]